MPGCAFRVSGRGRCRMLQARGLLGRQLESNCTRPRGGEEQFFSHHVELTRSDPRLELRPFIVSDSESSTRAFVPRSLRSAKSPLARRSVATSERLGREHEVHYQEPEVGLHVRLYLAESEVCLTKAHAVVGILGMRLDQRLAYRQGALACGNGLIKPSRAAEKVRSVGLATRKVIALPRGRPPSCCQSESVRQFAEPLGSDLGYWVRASCLWPDQTCHFRGGVVLEGTFAYSSFAYPSLTEVICGR